MTTQLWWGRTTYRGRRRAETRLIDSRDKALAAAQAAAEKQATDIVILHVAEVIGITDYFVITTAASQRQVKTVVDGISSHLRSFEIRPYRLEGEQERQWVVIDYLDVVVHVFEKELRDFYDLERLWKDADAVPFEETAPVAEREA